MKKTVFGFLLLIALFSLTTVVQSKTFKVKGTTYLFEDENATLRCKTSVKKWSVSNPKIVKLYCKKKKSCKIQGRKKSGRAYVYAKTAKGKYRYKILVDTSDSWVHEDEGKETKGDGSTSQSPTINDLMTPENCAKIIKGMTYNTVVSIIGHPTKLDAEASVCGYHTEIWSWDDSKGNICCVFFTNNIVDSCSYFFTNQ